MTLERMDKRVSPHFVLAPFSVPTLVEPRIWDPLEYWPEKSVFTVFSASQTTFYRLLHQRVNKAPLNGIEDLPTPDFKNAISH